MKKIIFLFTLVIATAMLSGFKQSGQNEMAEKNAKPSAPKDLKGINKPDVSESKTDSESFTTKKAPEGKPRILFILHNYAGQAAWSPSLWWSYQHTNPGQPGC